MEQVIKEQLDQMRLDIDGLAQLVDNLKPIDGGTFSTVNNGKLDNMTITINSLQIIDCHKSLLMAKAWIGKLQGNLGGESPYKNDGKRNSVDDIEPTDGKATKDDYKDDEPISAIEYARTNYKENWSLKNHVQKVDHLRELIEGTLSRYYVISGQIFIGTLARDMVVVHLTEAKLHLGFELGRLHDEK